MMNYDLYKYTPVKNKVAFIKNWSMNPMTYTEAMLNYPHANGIGILLGENSDGLLAIDFDGEEAIEFFQENISKELFADCCWTSGKANRFQIAYKVPEEYWEACRTIKVGPNKKLEFRWNGSQSVIPPSVHPETGKYKWIFEGEPEIIPEHILYFWLLAANPIIEHSDIEYPPVDNDDLKKLLELIGGKRLDYDTWRNLTWATCHSLGGDRIATEGLLKQYWNEEKPGEYKKILKGFSMERSPTIGSIIKISKEEYPEKTKNILKGEEALSYLKKAIQMKKLNKTQLKGE